MNINELKKQAIQELKVPGFDGKPMTFKVQQPRLLALAAQGKIPNSLLGIAAKMIKGEKKEGKFDITEGAKTIELYCRACMAEPTFEEIQDIITDEQMYIVFNYAMGDVSQLEPFRTDEGNGTSDSTGESVQQKTE